MNPLKDNEVTHIIKRALSPDTAATTTVEDMIRQAEGRAGTSARQAKQHINALFADAHNRVQTEIEQGVADMLARAIRPPEKSAEYIFYEKMIIGRHLHG